MGKETHQTLDEYVFEGNKERVTYVKVKPAMVPRIVKEHVLGGRPVTEYTIGAAE